MGKSVAAISFLSFVGGQGTIDVPWEHRKAANLEA